MNTSDTYTGAAEELSWDEGVKGDVMETSQQGTEEMAYFEERDYTAHIILRYVCGSCPTFFFVPASASRQGGDFSFCCPSCGERNSRYTGFSEQFSLRGMRR